MQQRGASVWSLLWWQGEGARVVVVEEQEGKEGEGGEGDTTHRCGGTRRSMTN